MKRNLSRMFRTGVAAVAALLCAMPFQAAAENYPSRPITLIMPFGAGNAPDTAARIIGDYLQRKHNITLLITSKPGGSGIPATLETVRARPDGYTISLTSANVLTVVPQYKKCGFTYKDLAPVAQVNVFTMGWGVRADSGIASVQDLMDKAKAERGKYSLASPGAFTAQRFYHANVMKLFPESDLPYVAYNGGAEIVTALLGNHISAGFTPVVNFKPHKDIRVIAVCGAQRDPNYPDAPTFKEMFGDGFVFDSVYGIVAPLKTPKDRIERLQSLIKEALSDPDAQAKFAKVNMTTNYLPPTNSARSSKGTTSSLRSLSARLRKPKRSKGKPFVRKPSSGAAFLFGGQHGRRQGGLPSAWRFSPGAREASVCRNARQPFFPRTATGASGMGIARNPMRPFCRGRAETAEPLQEQAMEARFRS